MVISLLRASLRICILERLRLGPKNMLLPHRYLSIREHRYSVRQQSLGLGSTTFSGRQHKSMSTLGLAQAKCCQHTTALL
jgi:hypothetical protein